jgi:hypothetical protein
MKTKYVVSICLLCLAIGFFTGRKTISYKTEVKYVPGEMIAGEVRTDTLIVRETIPANPVLPVIPDTVYRNDTVYVSQKVDTAAIIADYIPLRDYASVLFDNPTQGKFSIHTSVQYNKLSALDWEFTPVVREVTKYRIKVMQPYAGVSYNTFNFFTAAAGMFYYDIGIDLQYIRDLNENKTGYGIGINYKF